jgi:hypothetical protein
MLLVFTDSVAAYVFQRFTEKMHLPVGKQPTRDRTPAAMPRPLWMSARTMADCDWIAAVAAEALKSQGMHIYAVICYLTKF